MKSVIDSGHAELAPPIESMEEVWYLPIFGVYHPKKPDQIRGVFDASAKHQGVSLNDVLMTGPDFTNNLLGVLIKFRQEPVAVTTDIQMMFYCFLVEPRHRNYLRIFWYKDNKPSNELVEYRMCAHVFGNRPSPAVANYGLRKVAEVSTEEYGQDVTEFIRNGFYVDDGLMSKAKSEDAIDLMKRTQQALSSNGNIRLHKIASNSVQVLDAFPPEDLAKDLVHLDIIAENLPLQSSLGLTWDIQNDNFVFKVSSDKKGFTRRGVLSTINSIYDPIGFCAPVVVTGKLILRELMLCETDWDKPLPDDKLDEWKLWRDSPSNLAALTISRSYFPIATNTVQTKHLYIYSDASEKAISVAAYMMGQSEDNHLVKNFVMGKAKVAPKSGHTIPRLELCAAVLAVDIYNTVAEHIDTKFDKVLFFTDSKVVLGYIQNTTRRFYNYVSNRVEKILRSTTVEQWKYVKTNHNPADFATRPVKVKDMVGSPWVQGPDKFYVEDERSDFPLVEPDKEIRQIVDVRTTDVKESLGSKRFEKFSSWSRLVLAMCCLIRLCKVKRLELGLNQSDINQTAERILVKSVQQDNFPQELSTLSAGSMVDPSSHIAKLNPILDKDGLLRVGGGYAKPQLHCLRRILS